jgi:NifU-like protein involved in Fe-S cluster formation
MDWGDNKNKNEILKIVELVDQIYNNKENNKENIDEKKYEKIRFLALLKFIGDRGQILTVQKYNSDRIKISNTERAILASSDRIFIAHTLNIKQPIIFSRLGNINVYTPNNYDIEKSKVATNKFIKNEVNLDNFIIQKIKNYLNKYYEEKNYKLNYDENQEILKNIIIKNIKMNDQIKNIKMNDQIPEFFVRYVENINIENIENINIENIENIITGFINTLKENLRNNNRIILKSIRIKNMYKNIQNKFKSIVTKIVAFRKRKRILKNVQNEMKILEIEKEQINEIIIKYREI